MKTQIKSMILMAVSIAFLWVGCSGNSKEGQKTASSRTASVQEYDEPVEYIGTGEHKNKVYKGTETQDFPDASIDEWKYENDRFELSIGGDSYQLQSHTHTSS